MKISNIEIKNFKSFKDVSAKLNDFNVVVGASASGKSNFIEAFKFLKDICEDFENGIYSQGEFCFKILIATRKFNHALKQPLVIKNISLKYRILLG